MKVRKAVQKIAAIGAGLSMVGATILGAMAADLSEYPDPLFIKDGQFNGVIVVGDRAAAEDVVGAINIATSLQYAVAQPVATPSAPGGAGGVLSVSGDAVPISEPNDMLEIRERMGLVRETMTEFDLAGLQGGTIVTDEGATDYNQYLRFSDAVLANDTEYIPGGTVTFEEDEDDVVGDYLKFTDGKDMFEYEIEFEEGVSSSLTTTHLDDLEDEELNILGKVFAIVDTKLSGNALTLDLLGGDVLDTMEEGETRTYTIDGKEYEVNLLIVSDNLEKVKFVINGEVTDDLSDGDTDVMRDGIEIGIRDVLPNEAQEETGGDLVEFFLGANKVELSDTNATDDNFDTSGVEVHEEDIEDGRVKIKGVNLSNNDGFEIQTIEYRLKADSPKGDVFVPPGHGLKEYLDEPEGMLSDVWDIRYEGLTDTGVSIIRVDANGDDSYDLQFTNREGLEYDIPFVDNSRDTFATFKYGDEDNDLVFHEGIINASATGVSLTNNQVTTGDGAVVNVTALRTAGGPVDGCDNILNIDEKDFFVLTDNPQDETSFTHILTYESIDTVNRQVTFNDEATGQREVTFSTSSLPNSCILGTSNTLVVGGNTYRVYVGTGTGNSTLMSNASVGNASLGKFPLAVDQNSDGLVDGDEIVVVVNGGGILDLGNQSLNNNSEGPHWLNAPTTDTAGTSTYQILTTATGGFNLQLRSLASEFDGNGVLDSGRDENVTVQINATSGNNVDLNVVSPQNFTFTNTNGEGVRVVELQMESLDEEDLKQGLTTYGAFFEQTDESSTNNADSLTIEYPLSQRGADVFVVFGETQTSRVGAAAGGAVVLNPINVGAAKLASEVAGQEMSTNMLLVGGPCINSAAAKVMGSDEPLCGDASGIAPGTAIIKLFEHGDTVSVIVAGYDAQDTRRATKVLAEYKDWADKLVGKEVVVTGTSMADIDVSAPVATP